MVIVNLVAATICFLGQCHPALIGPETPTGEFQLQHLATNRPGYGGDILGFDMNGRKLKAIHRTWLGSPSQHRAERLRSDDPDNRRFITAGCINVAPEVYEALVDCCSNDTLQVYE